METELSQNDRFRHRKDFFVGVNNITAFLGHIACKERNIGDASWGAALIKVQRDLLELKRNMPDGFEEVATGRGVEDVISSLSGP